MRVWTCTAFKGHYPVGVAAVIRAENKQKAKELLEVALAAKGLTQEIDLTSLVPFVDTPQAVILCNGNY